MPGAVGVNGRRVRVALPDDSQKFSDSMFRPRFRYFRAMKSIHAAQPIEN
jgi:hypothetical protein